MPEPRINIDRVSIPYHVPSTGSGYGEYNFYSHMFIEDATRDLFPTGGSVDHTPVFRLSSNDEHVSRVIESAFSHRAHHAEPRRSLSALLSTFGNQTVHRLFFNGPEAFEVAPMSDTNDQIVGFSVLRLDGFKRFAGFTWQTIPKNALEGAHWENSQPVNRRRVRIPRNRVVHIRLPQEYRRIPSGLRTLRRVENTGTIYGVQNLHMDGTIQMPYDIKELWGIERRAVASITQSTGWNSRWLFDDAVTSYYKMRRFLRFEEFKVRLRGAVVDAINRILVVAGGIASFKAEVSLHHLPTLEEIAVSRNDLVAGRLGFSQMMDQYSIYRRGCVTSQE